MNKMNKINKTRRRLMENAGLMLQSHQLKLVEGIKVQDDEGEAITTLTDVPNAADLMRRIEKEPEEYQEAWADIPFAFDVVGPDSMYNTTEDDVKDLEHYPPTTYEKWIKGYRDWAKEVLSDQ